jgi:hypothetical protein
MIAAISEAPNCPIEIHLDEVSEIGASYAGVWLKGSVEEAAKALVRHFSGTTR